MLTNLIFLKKVRHVSQVLFHKLNNSRYVEYIDLKVVLRILVKKCLDKTYLCKKCDTCVNYIVSQTE